MTEPIHDLSTIGGRISFALEQSGRTRTELAHAADVTTQAVGQWINGKTKNLRNEHLFATADVTGFSAQWLATGRGSMRSVYVNDERIAHMVKLMESLPTYALDEAVKGINSVAELVRRARTGERNGKVGNGD